MSEVKLRETMNAEMKPDVYGGKAFDEHVPRWWIQCAGDRDGDHSDHVALSPNEFPPGTRIKVLEPHCQTCGVAPTKKQDMGGGARWVCDCEFDWREWAESKYG